MNDDKTIASAENELGHSIEKTYQLYLLLFNLLKNFKLRAEIRRDHLKSLPILDKQEFGTVDLLANNPFFEELVQSNALSATIESYPSNWDENSEYTAQLFSELLASEAFATFKENGNSFSAGKKLAQRFITQNLFESDAFHNHLQELSIYWNDDCAFILPMIEKTLRKHKEGSEKGFEPLPQFSTEDDREFVFKLLRKSINNFNKYDEEIKALTKGWDFERIAEMDLLIMRMGVIEAVEFSNIPAKVSLNEYIDMAKFYASPKSKQYINGLLDNLYKKLLANGTIKKTGRGLIE